MGLNHSPSVITNSLLANYDFANIKSFVPVQNLLKYSDQFTNSPWTTIGSNVSVTQNTTSNPLDFQLNADTLATSSYVSGDSIYQDVSLSGTGTITLSVFVKATSTPPTTITLAAFFLGSSTQPFSFNFNPSTGVISQATATGYSVSYADGWYRIYTTVTGTIAANNVLRWQIYLNSTGSVYLYGSQLELNSSMNEYTATTATTTVRSTNIIDTIGGYNMSDSYGNNAYYINTTNSYMQFTRTSAIPKDGGGCFVGTSGPLSVTNFLYNDHTWEVWFRIDDRNPGGYGDVTEGSSTLALYSGYHAGFMYTATVMSYIIWNGAAGPTCASWTLGDTGAQINQGSWYQIVVTRSGNVFTPYINGSPLGSGSTTVTSVSGVFTSNQLWLGKTQNVAPGASVYLLYSKNSVANMKMYNRTLSAPEISQNFNALRGRFGI